MEQFRGRTEARLDSLESMTDKHEERIKELEDKNEQIVKIDTLMEMQIETNKEQTKTLNGINENLTKLNEGYNVLDKRMEVVEESQKEMTENSNINIMHIFKSAFSKLLIMGIVGGVIFLLGMYFASK